MISVIVIGGFSFDINVFCNYYNFIVKIICNVGSHRDKWDPVIKAWHVLWLRREEWPPICRVAANDLNKQSRTTDKALSSNFWFG
jgi:hypothetical protein